MLNKISISVIVTCHNLEKYLPECIDSIYNQTMPPTEIIIVHDGCSDLSQCYKGCTNILRTQNKGVARSRHEGALLANSENLLFVDGDDTLSPNYIQAMVDTKVETKADVIYPNVFLWSNWDKKYPMRNGWHESEPEIDLDVLLKSNPIVVSSLVTKSLYFKAGGFENLPMLEDYAFWLKCYSLGGTFSKCVRAVLNYRQRQNGRNRQSDDLKNQMYFDIKQKYETLNQH